MFTINSKDNYFSHFYNYNKRIDCLNRKYYIKSIYFIFVFILLIIKKILIFLKLFNIYQNNKILKKIIIINSTFHLISNEKKNRLEDNIFNNKYIKNNAKSLFKENSEIKKKISFFLKMN